MSEAACTTADHDSIRVSAKAPFDESSFERAAAIFRVLGEPARLRLVAELLPGEMCVTQLAEILGDSLSAVSQRLKLLRSERIVRSRRDGKHVFYALADSHISEMAQSAIAHAAENSDDAGGAERGR